MTKPTATPLARGGTLRPECDFSCAARAVTARRCAEGANVVVVAPDLLDVSPNPQSVDEPLRALAPILRRASSA